MMLVRGVAASSGVAAGKLWIHSAELPPVPAGTVADTDVEVALLASAMRAVADDLTNKALDAEGELADILFAQAAMAGDPELEAMSTAAVRDKKVPAARAVLDSCESYASILAASDSEYLAARAQDVRDVGARIARRLLGVHDPDLGSLPEAVIVAAVDLAPADMAGARTDLMLAIATEQGSRTSHTAIVARALGVPAVVGATGLLDALAGAETIAVDGDVGEIHVDPDAETMAALDARAAAVSETRNRLAEIAGTEPAATADGVRVELAANVATLVETEAAVARGAEGVGLLRTELMYVDASEPPTVAQQAEAFGAIADALGGQRLVIRTFDFGADKPVPFLDVDPEPNPALGIRGLRFGVAHPKLFAEQLTAIAEAAHGGSGRKLALMAPMVATVDEAEWFLGEVQRAGCEDVEVGIMVEVPSAVFLAPELAERLDFFSIGTNDLTQYLHAADRLAGPLANLQDPFSPAVLRAVEQVCRGAEGKAWVGVCGEAGGDPAWAMVAVGLGVDELSMGADALLPVKAALRQTTLATCQDAARAALAASDAAAARAAATAVLGDALR
jgi:phosphotransferase system enzyme I (PtsI)